ncbi:restriction endonuclease subunit S [Klebsiella oxytoca]|uniref:restriction endonuclease subunit S n=1 Tax=Klebsiella oxytoca TaxID=571 RepID=UPI0031D58294
MAPKLRFKGFVSEWEGIRLQDVASKIKDKNKDNSIATVLTNSATLGIVDQKSYFEREIVTDVNLTGYYIVELGDFIYNPRISITAPVGPIKMNCFGKGIMSPLYTVFRFKNNNTRFYKYYFESSAWHNYIKNVSNSGARHDRMNISTSDFFALPIFQPTLEEQTKIADFLSSIDEKITLLNKQYDLLCQYKKGMMQKIFSQELRFKDENGGEFPEWNSCQLRDVSTRITRKNKENNQTILTISGRDGLVDQMSYFNKQIASKNVSGYYLINNGEFAYNKSYSHGYPMGAIKMLNNYDKGVVSTLYICFELNTNQSNSFYQHYFESGLQNRSIEKVAQEGARNHGLLNIGVNDFFDIELQIPSLKEQIKIADFLTALDDKITTKKAELDKLKTWKQGLLQQMFV